MAVQTAKKELPACPVETTLTPEPLGSRKQIPENQDLPLVSNGELKKSVGNITQKVLTAQLRDMEESGLLTRTVYPEVPPRVEYSLSELGESMKPILDAMEQWGTNYKASLETD